MDNKRKKEIKVGDLIKDTWYDDSLGIVLKVDQYSYNVFWIKMSIGLTERHFEKNLHYEYVERIEQ